MTLTEVKVVRATLPDKSDRGACAGFTGDAAGGTGMPYAFSRSVEVLVPAAAAAVFEVLDDPLRLGRHMARPSPMMLGGSMRVRPDPRGGRAVGSVIRVEGSILGVPLRIVERIVERDPPRRKVWETIEEPRLIVFGRYRLGFEIVSERAGSRVRVFIDYDLPTSGPGRLLGSMGAAAAYARWCIDRMAAEATGTAGGAPAGP